MSLVKSDLSVPLEASNIKRTTVGKLDTISVLGLTTGWKPL